MGKSARMVMKVPEDSSEQHDSVLQTKTGPVTANQERAVSIEGRRIIAGRYAILGALGRGGMGEVWHAFDLKLRVDVALKSLRSDRAHQDVESLRREVRTAREVISPNVCRIFDLVVEDKQELVSMEYIDGITLAELLQKGALELEEAGDIAMQFLAGLQAIHQAGLVHRDFKPENVMITRTGRVVVMDFGIAKPVAQVSETISGTPSYMAPEQLEGRKLDQRSDLFAAGVVLAEMIVSQDTKTKESRQALLKSMRQEPLPLPDHPWSKLIERAVAKNYEDRFSSALSMLQALQEIAQRGESDELKKPYPGLSAFTEQDVEFFFGRELEVEAVIKKLQQLHLMAIIGPSGAGKTSFLQAGLIPYLPEDWACIVCQPGDSPNVNLAHALVDEFSGDKDATHKMLRFEEVDVAVSLLRQWRNKHSEVLLVVDRFEELFTLNPKETQSRFAELLERVALAADVRILLAMRDDFLFFCHNHSQLAPVFSALTPIGQLTRATLRQVLVQPAQKCGYRFEDDSLVDEIVSDVEKERGALPLMAFAAEKLWEKRDRQSGLLTRSAYQEIGGVAGALAQHAENTMERIGTVNYEVVREIFRNLTTAQGTRAARDREELLSVFQNRKDAEEALRELINARLLTSFDVKDEEKSRIEIIHESLLTSWPRLVRWQTQDADSAQFHDQLRQAAQVWEKGNRSEDLLWTGTALLELQAWRQRYSRGLTTTEEAFTQAMIQRASRKRRQKRVVIAAMFVILIGILAVISDLWRREMTARVQSDAARKQAIVEAKYREAAQLLALGRLRITEYPMAAFAYAIASLEKADTREGRRFALEALSQGPPAFLLAENINSVRFSPDGKWLATGGVSTGIRLWSRADGSYRQLFGQDGSVPFVHFTPKSDILAGGWKDIRFWSIPDGKEVGKTKIANSFFVLNDSELITIDQRVKRTGARNFYAGAIPNGTPQLIGTWLTKDSDLDIDPNRQIFVYSRQDSIYLNGWKDPNSSPVLLGKHPTNVNWVSFHSHHVASADQSGEIRLWRLSTESSALERTFQLTAPKNRFYLDVDRSATKLAASEQGGHSGSEVGFVWNLQAPVDADPMLLRADVPWLNTMTLDPSGQWLFTANAGAGILWSLQHQYPYVFRGQSPPFIRVAFTPDSKQIVSTSDDGTVRLWSLTKEKKSRILAQRQGFSGTLCLDSTGKKILGTSRFDWNVYLLPANGGELQHLPVPPKPSGFHYTGPGAFGPNGHLAAIAQAPPPIIRIFNLDSKQYFDFSTAEDDKDCGLGKNYAGWIFDMKFTADGRLITSGTTGLRIWNLDHRSSKMIRPCKNKEMFFSTSADGNRILITDSDSMEERKRSELSAFDLKEQRSWQIHTHGNLVSAVATDSTGSLAVTGDLAGIIRVGPITGEEPHILFGHRQRITSVAISLDGKWIASGSDDGTIRIWPMPKGEPFHMLPYKELMKRLHALTNLLVVADSKADTGYRMKAGPFPGWEIAPTW